MIRSLRARHRLWTVALALALPVGVTAALVLRPKLPLALEIPFSGAERATIGPIVARDDLFESSRIRARLWSEPGEPANGSLPHRVLELTPEHDFARPDVLVYWSPAAPESDAPATGSILLGSLDGTQARRMKLPENARNARGWLCIYSLVEPEIVASAVLEPGS
ncbi:MAG: hypothetical protein ACKVWV_17925 [Planctomycetota bacterium]